MKNTHKPPLLLCSVLYPCTYISASGQVTIHVFRFAAKSRSSSSIPRPHVLDVFMLPAKVMLSALAAPLRALQRSAGPLCIASRMGRAYSSDREDDETPEEFDRRFIDFFNQPNIDGWLVRKGLYDLHCYDVVPEPTVAAAVLRACRRVNDFALAVRFLEAVKIKCGRKVKEIYPYIIQELRPVLNELGVPTPEEMGLDKPLLFNPSPDWWPEEYYEIYNIPKNRTLPVKEFS